MTPPSKLDTRITLYKLEVFDLVVELGSVSRTADQLFVSQPVVTAHIRSLEKRVGARLFYRKGRQLALTEAGRAVHSWARDVLTHTRELSRHLEGLSDGSRGSVVVGASMSIGSYVLPSILSTFRRDRPLASIRCNISDSERETMATEAGENDFAIVILDAEPTSDGLEAEKLREEEFVAVVAPDFEPHQDSITVADLAQLPLIESPSGLVRRTLVERQLKKLGVGRLNVVIELGHPEAMKRAAARGLGVTLQFRSTVMADLEAGTLREMALEDATLGVPVYLVRRKDKFLSAIQLDLMNRVRNEIRAGIEPPAVGDAGPPAPLTV